MEITDILEQMMTTYGRPTPTALLQNDTLFQNPYSPTNAPEVLFRRIKDCQEIMTLGEDPYTPMQLPNNAIRLLLGCGLYQRNFEEWDRKLAADKIWINLKPFIQEAYQQRLNTTGNTPGQHGYVQNVIAVLEESDDDKDEDVATVITQMAALTTQSQLTAASTAVTSSSVAAAIQQLNTNQQVMMQQMMAYVNASTTRNPPVVHNPPLMHFNIPTIGSFQPGGNAQGARRPGLASFQVDAEHHALIPQLFSTKVVWVRASCQLLSRESWELARLHETRPQCTLTSSKDTAT